MFTDNTITVDYMTSDLLFGDYPKGNRAVAAFYPAESQIKIEKTPNLGAKFQFDNRKTLQSASTTATQ